MENFADPPSHILFSLPTPCIFFPGRPASIFFYTLKVTLGLFQHIFFSEAPMHILCRSPLAYFFRYPRAYPFQTPPGLFFFWGGGTYIFSISIPPLQDLKQNRPIKPVLLSCLYLYLQLVNGLSRQLFFIFFYFFFLTMSRFLIT